MEGFPFANDGEKSTMPEEHGLSTRQRISNPKSLKAPNCKRKPEQDLMQEPQEPSGLSPSRQAHRGGDE
jgi:hypothetical protein